MAIRQHAPLVLASGSTIRQQLLKSVGLTFSVAPSGVDEDQVKVEIDADFPMLALTLAKAKAVAVSIHHPNAYVIGADQLCVFEETILSKPGSYENAEAQLAQLSGRTHRQYCGVVIVYNGKVEWAYADVATLTLRDLSPDDIRAYVAADAPLSSCGSYKFEGLGRHLFATVDGDHDVIQGLPLVPLLAAMHALQLIELKTA